MASPDKADHITLRTLNMDDIGDVEILEQACFASPWSRQSLISDIIYNPNARYIGIEHQGKVIAYAGMWVVCDEGHITNVAVSPVYRRRGFGMTLMNALIIMGRVNGVNRMTLEVRVSNVAAQEMYRKLGFTIATTRKKYYPDNGEDAYLMCRENIMDDLGI
jgi:[ribosomal protein S18]-alanine N-acetyltransferase